MKDTHEEIMAQVIGAMNERADIEETVQEEKSAKEALPKLKALAERTRNLRHRADALGNPSQETLKELERLFRSSRAFARMIDTSVLRMRQLAVEPQRRDWLYDFEEELRKDEYKMELPWLELLAQRMQR